MSTTSMNKVLRQLHQALLAQDAAVMSDGQLLERFLGLRDETALSTLVRRHGPMVWGVCRRVLRNHHDAEDAFQATFLVLVRKADSVRPREMVANWLYGVAHQTARKARAMGAKRQSREQAKYPLPEAKPIEGDRASDLTHSLDEELSRLPEKYRSVIVLCDLEGKTRKEAASQLDCPEGTIAGRLARARAMLANRIARRGLVVTGATLAGTFAHQAAMAAPGAVVVNAIHATSLVASGKAVAGVVSAKAVALAEGVVKAMFLAKLGNLAAVLVLVLALCGIGFVAYAGGGAGTTADATELGDKEQEASVAALKKIEGTWIIVERIEDGKKESVEEFREVKHRVVIKDGKWTDINRAEIVFQCALKCDATRTPIHLDKLIDGKWDAHINPPPNLYRWVLAIAKLVDDDTLVVCSAQPNEARPADFSAGQKSRRRLTTYKRQSKETALPVSALAAKAKSDRELIQGTWKVLKTNHNGKMLPNEYAIGDDQVWHIGDGKVSIRYGDGTTKEIAFRLDKAAKLKTVDVTVNDEGTGAKYLGLYTLDDDTLQFAYNRNAAPTAQRPTDFFSEAFLESRGRRYFLLQRQKPAAPKQDRKAADPVEKAILGGWKVVSFETVGNKAGWFVDPEAIAFGREADFGKTRIPPGVVIESKDGRVLTMEYRVSSSQSQHQIDFIPAGLRGGPGKETFQGIFRFDGDKLRICVNSKATDARPTDFGLMKGGNRFVVVLQRDPDAPKQKEKPGADAKDRSGPSVLLVNGSPAKARFENATEYLNLAINPFGDKPPPGSAKVRTKVVSAAQFAGFHANDLQAWVCIFLCDVPRLAAGEAERLEAYVKDGGGVVFCLGPSVDVDEYNKELRRLLPLKLLGARDAKPDHVFLFNVDRKGPTPQKMPLKTFANEQDWLGVQVHKFIRLEEPTPNSQAKIIATFVERNVSKPGKAPRAGIAIVEHRPFANAKGESGGRVVLLTTTVNMDWTNWPGSPSFGAMTHELLHFVGADRKPRDEPKKDDNP